MKSLKTFTPLMVSLTKREFRLRYLGSMLGSYWNLIHPLIMIAIYTIVFSQVMHARLGGQVGPYSYSLYLCSGLLAWNFMGEIINRGVNTLVDNSSFLKKISFPPLILYGAMIGSAAINFFISFGIFFIVLQFIKPVSLLYLILYFSIVLLMALFALGIAVTLGCLNVFMRDFQQITAVVFQLWFWFTPVVYLPDIIPTYARKLLYLNPAYVFIEPLHQLLYFNHLPPLKFWGLMLVWIFLSLGIAAFIYKKTISYVRDYL